MRIFPFFAILLLSAGAGADSVHLRRDDVIPVVMQTELTFRDTQEGDTFRADANASRVLPPGSHLEGVVNRVVQKSGNKPAFMDIEFTTIILPDGHRTDFHGTPIPLTKNYVTRDRDGRWAAKKGVSRDTVVLGTTAGGLVIGSMIRKPLEGAILGLLIGIVAQEVDKEDVGDGNIVVAKGGKIGARVDENLTIQFDGRWDRGAHDDRDVANSAGYDKYGYDRDGRYNPKYDTTKDGPNRGGVDYDKNGFNTDGYDKYGYDRDGKYNGRYDTTRDNPAPNRTGYDDSRPQDRQPSIQIEMDRKPMRYADPEKPYHSGWILMVPLRSTAEQLGYTVNRDGPEGQITVENESNVLVVEQASRGYSLNHRRGSLPMEVQVRDGVAYIPIDAFTMLVKGSVYVNGTKYRPQA